MATFNKNEVVLEKIKQASLYDLESGKLLNRLTSIEGILIYSIVKPNTCSVILGHSDIINIHIIMN